MLKYIVLLLLSITSQNHAAAQNHVRFSDIKPGMTDEAICQEAVCAANRAAGNYSWHEEYTAAKIISFHWKTTRNKKGRITGRQIHVQLYCKNLDEKCKTGDFTFRQKYMDGDRYSRKLYFVACGGLYEVECD